MQRTSCSLLCLLLAAACSSEPQLVPATTAGRTDPCANDPSTDGRRCSLESGRPGICVFAQGGCVAVSICGDGVVDTASGETCDDGDDDACTGTCNSDCSGPSNLCGDGVARCGEICDDGDTDACTGSCNQDCTGPANTCGDGVARCGEACDDGDTDTCTGSCNQTCTEPANTCGDQIVRCGESCDDGVATTCAAPRCGDGVLGCGERCDDGDTDDCSGSCDAACSAPANACGDGRIRCGESCDDANTKDGDGCSGSCAVESGWSCGSEQPSSCTSNQFTRIRPGSFRMGSAATEEGHMDDDTQHDVTLTGAFSISRHEVTQADFEAALGWNPSQHTGCPACPVENVSWYDAVAYANAISRSWGLPTCYAFTEIVCADRSAAGTDETRCQSSPAGGIQSARVQVAGGGSIYRCEGVRLPTEAEWEYAARAGSTSATYNGDLTSQLRGCEQPHPVLDPIGWFCGNAGGSPHAVGTRAANRWGLSDMLGNAAEWVHDHFGPFAPAPLTDPEGRPEGSLRVVRGGGWSEWALMTRAAYRGLEYPERRFDKVGFRLARSLASCVSSGSCGDGVAACSEACDDGDRDDCTGSCNSDCSGPANRCGDHILACGETCDDGDLDECTPACNATCTGPGNRCGDGRVRCGEACDDGNATDGDGCSSSCRPEPPYSCDRSEPSICSPPTPFVTLAPGRFTMGSPATEGGREGDETEHAVTLTRPFVLGRTEVTQAEFEQRMGWNPSQFSGPSRPVERITWFDALAFANQASLGAGLTPCYVLEGVTCQDDGPAGADYMQCMSATRRGIKAATVRLNGVASVYACTGFRLPTEAEWEYAARAGTTRSTYAGDVDPGNAFCQQSNPVLDPIAWFSCNSTGQTQNTGVLAPNAWGLADALGNVFEWCHDWYGEYPRGAVTDPEGPPAAMYRVARGGSWNATPYIIRAAERAYLPAEFTGNFLGLRLARSL